MAQCFSRRDWLRCGRVALLALLNYGGKLIAVQMTGGGWD